MAVKGMIIYIKFFIICTFLSRTTSLSVSPSGTKANRTTKYTSSTPSPSVDSLGTPTPAKPVTPPQDVAEYRKKSSGGYTCILMQADGLIDVSFIYHKDVDGVSEYLPDKPQVTGDCINDDTATMKLAWKGHTLLWKFDKTPGGEKWYVSSIELTIDTNFKHYEHIQKLGNSIRLTNRNMLIMTRLGDSYKCSQSEFPLTPDEDDVPMAGSGVKGNLILREFQIQPFMYKSEYFGPPSDCALLSNFRDETAPIAVGSTLALAVLLTVAGYGAFRYFKIKKVQYNTMG